jgi:hypothetical protein
MAVEVIKMAREKDIPIVAALSDCNSNCLSVIESLSGGDIDMETDLNNTAESVLNYFASQKIWS